MQALLGTTVQVRTLTSTPATVTFSSGSVQPFNEVRIKGKGLPHPSSWVKSALGLNRGDLVVIPDVLFPESLTERQQKGIEEAFELDVCLESDILCTILLLFDIHSCVLSFTIRISSIHYSIRLYCTKGSSTNSSLRML